MLAITKLQHCQKVIGDKTQKIKKYIQKSDERLSIVEIGTMKSLSTLNASKNRLTEIPLELAASTTVMEILLNDNCTLVEIPTKIMAMQSLKLLEAERKLWFFHDFIYKKIDV